MKNIRIIQIIILLVAFISFSVNTFVSGSMYPTGTLVASGGSKYELYVEISTITWVREETYIVNVGIIAKSWGGSISDFHDIKLYFGLGDGNYFEITDESDGLGDVNSKGQTFERMWSIIPDALFPSTFSIFIGSTFREDKSWATDPETDDRWNKVVDISLYDYGTEPTTNTSITDNQPPQITSPPDVVYEEGSTNHNIRWNATDENPSSYSIERNGKIIESGAWEIGLPIEISVDGLEDGKYTYTISVTDTDGLTTMDLVYVEVLSKPKTSSEDATPYSYHFSIIGFIAIVIKRKRQL